MTNQTNLQDFDITQFLDDYNIIYRSGVKNVGIGWVGLETCPFCGVGGWHFGIHLTSKTTSCWACDDGKGNVFTLVRAILSITDAETFKVINKYTDGVLEYDIRERGKELVLPSKLKPLTITAKRYLKKRNYDLSIIDKYKLQDTGSFSEVTHGSTSQDFKFRIFIPIFYHRRIISYTGRDYTEIRDPRYKHPLLEAAIKPPSSCVYNIDNIKDRAILLEGPTDVWRMGDNSISIQGKTATPEQIRMIAEKQFKRLVILLDEGADDAAEQLGNSFYGLADDVRVAYLEKGDPGQLDQIEALKIKQTLLYEE